MKVVICRNTLYVSLDWCSPMERCSYRLLLRVKRRSVPLFGHYTPNAQQQSTDVNQLLEKKQFSYIDAIHFTAASFPSTTPLSDIHHVPEFALLLPLFERILCTPASSAPVERVFSHSGLLVRPLSLIHISEPTRPY